MPDKITVRGEVLELLPDKSQIRLHLIGLFGDDTKQGWIPVTPSMPQWVQLPGTVFQAEIKYEKIEDLTFQYLQKNPQSIGKFFCHPRLTDVQLRKALGLEQPAEISSIAICAIRYAMSIAQQKLQDDCIAGVRSYWEMLSVKNRSVIIRDLKSEIDREQLIEFASITKFYEFYEWACNFKQPSVAVGGIEYLGKLTLFAIRYCIGRTSYMPSLIVDATKANWDLLNESDRVAIRNEVRLAIETRHLGMECDRRAWMGFDRWIAESI